MATYIPGVQGYYPDFEPFVPDYKFLSGVLDQRTDRYNTNYKAINDLYGKVVYADLTRDDSIEMRDQYANLLAPKLEQVASMDLSLQQNADAARALFQPFYDNDLVVKDLITTQQYKKELGYANSLLESDDRKTREKYWQTGVEALQYQLQDFKTAEPDKALGMALPKYVPDANLYEMSLEVLKESGLSIEQESFDPNDPHKTWIIKQKNGSLVTPIAFETVKRTLLDDPRVVNAYYTDAYVKSRKFADQGMESGQFTTVDEGRTAWASNIIADIQAKTLRQNQKTKDNLKESEAVKSNWEQYANTNGIIPGSDEDKAMIEALAKYDGDRAKLESENDILKESQDPAPSDENLISKAYNLLMSYNISGDMMAAAQQYSMKDASLTFKSNPYREMELKFAHDFAIEDQRFRNDAKLKELEHGYDKKLEDYKNRFKSSILDLFSKALTGNEKTSLIDRDGDGKPDTDADVVAMNNAAKGTALKDVTNMQIQTIAEAHAKIEGLKADGKPYQITVDTKDGKKDLSIADFAKVMAEPGNEVYRAQLYNKYRDQIATADKNNPSLYAYENGGTWQRLMQGFKSTDDRMAAVVEGSRKEAEVYANNLSNAAETEGGKSIKELQKRGMPSIITSPLKKQLQNQEDLSEADKSKANALYLSGQASISSKLLTREEYRDQFRRAYQLGKIKDEDGNVLKNLGTSFQPSEIKNTQSKRQSFGSSTASWLGNIELDQTGTVVHRNDVESLADKAYDAQMKVLNTSLTGALVPTKTQEGKPTGTFKTFGFDQWMRGMAVDEMTTGNIGTYPVYKQFIDPYTVIQDEKAAGMLSDFLTQYNNSPNAVVVTGDLTGASETPGASNDKAKQILGQALQDMAAAIASSDDKSKAKETSPYFTIKYAPVYGAPTGDRENAAYILEFNNDYIKKFAGGSDDAKTYIGNSEVPEYSKMTMLFPRDMDVNPKNSDAYNFSGIQNKIQSSPEGRYTYNNPTGGKLNVYPAPGGNSWMYNFNTLVYDPNSGNFVTQDIAPPTVLAYPDGTPVKRNDLDRMVGGLENVLNGISTDNIKAQSYNKKNYFNK